MVFFNIIPKVKPYLLLPHYSNFNCKPHNSRPMKHNTNMKKRRRLSKKLERRVEGCPDKNLSADEVVDYLRSAFKGQCERTASLKQRVQSILEESKMKNDDGASDSSGVSTSGKKEDCEPEFNLLGKRKRARVADEAVELELEVVTSRNQKVDPVKAKKSRGGGESEERVIFESGVEKKVKHSDSRCGGDIVRAKEDGPMFKDLGGMKKVVEELTRKVIRPLRYLKLARLLDDQPTTGILLHGPPGCGKTTLARAIANEIGLPFHTVSASQLVSGISGESEENIRELFSKAFRTAPSIVFIDEIDAIASKRENHQRAMDTRIVTELMSCMEKSSPLPVGDSESENSGYVLVIGATNRADAIDPALRRPGRFDQEFLLPVPDESARIQILSVLTQKMFRVEANIDLRKIARATPGFVGADLHRLTKEASNIALNRIVDPREKQALDLLPEDFEMASITMADFEIAARTVQPSTKREGFSEVPDVKWDDIGGMHQLRQEFDRYIIRRIKFPELYEKREGTLERGFLLYGPPGCGKTLIAMAVANEAGANFIHIKGAELLNKYVGESELAVRTLFSRARTCSPCIIFFDEVDTLTKKCGSEDSVVERVLKTLMVELAGGGPRKDVYVIGATNRPEVMDSAVLRPGRFGKHMYVPLPSAEERGLILKTFARDKLIDAGVDLMAIGKDLCEKFSGADLNNLMSEADMAALDDDPSGTIKDEHFTRVLENVFPSIPDEEILRYDRLSKTLKNRAFVPSRDKQAVKGSQLMP